MDAAPPGYCENFSYRGYGGQGAKYTSEVDDKN